MKRCLLILFLMTFTFAADAGNVLMIDLNNSTNEMNSCNQGLAENNARTGSNDSLYVIGQGARVNAQTIKKYVDDMEHPKDPGKKPVVFDTILISGHNGNGEFFGNDPRNHFTALDLHNLIYRYPTMKNSVVGLGLWGCYGGNVNAAEHFWEFPVSDNIKTVTSWPLQSYKNTAPPDWKSLQEYCSNRHQIDDAQGQVQIEEAFHDFTNAKAWGLSTCYRDGVCSPYYNKLKDPPQTCFHSYQELHNRCKDFDPGNKKLQLYQNYMEARDPNDPNNHKFDNPPPDGEDEYVTEGLSGSVKRSEVREFYNQLQLWRHCNDQLAADKTRGLNGYQMPVPAQVIRLTKFETLKANFARIEQGPLNDYNMRLKQIGLGQYALDDLSHMSRRQIVENIENAEAALNRMAGNDRGPQNFFNIFTPKNNTSIDPNKMLTMAEGFDRSLRMIDTVCTDFTYVHEGAIKMSPCVARYGEEPEWQGR